MADVVAWIAGSKPSLAQEKVQAVLIRCRVMCWTSCSRCVALAIWIYGDKQRGVSICMRAVYANATTHFHLHVGPRKVIAAKCLWTKMWPAWMTCLQGSLAHRYTDSSLVELNLTDIFFFPKVSCERVYLPCGLCWFACAIHAETMDFLPLRAAHPHMATTQARQTSQTFTHMCRAARMVHFEHAPWNFLYIIKALQCSFTNPKYDVMELEASKNWHLFWAWIGSIENALGKSQFWISWLLQCFRDGSMLTIESNVEVFSLTRSSPVHAIVWFYSQIWGFDLGGWICPACQKVFEKGAHASLCNSNGGFLFGGGHLKKLNDNDPTEKWSAEMHRS